MTGATTGPETTLPRVSVIVPAHNEERTLKRTLRALADQDYPNFEVIVVDDASTDRTGDVAAGFERVKVIRHSRGCGLAPSYNSGIAAAEGDIIATLHADCAPTRRDWIRRCVAHFEDPTVGIVTTPFIVPDQAHVGAVEYVFMFALRGDREAASVERMTRRDVPFISGKCDFYRGSLLRDLGGFRAVTRVAGEDKDLSLRVRGHGFRILLEPKVPVVHLYGSHQQGLLANWSKAVQYGEAARGVYRLHGRFHSREIMANTFLLAALVAGGALSVALLSWVPALIALGLLAAKNAQKALPLLRAKRGLVLYLLAIPIGAVDNLLMGFGVLKGPRRTAGRFANASGP